MGLSLKTEEIKSYSHRLGCDADHVVLLKPAELIEHEPSHEKTNNLHYGENKGADELRSNCEADQCL